MMQAEIFGHKKQIFQEQYGMNVLHSTSVNLVTSVAVPWQERSIPTSMNTNHRIISGFRKQIIPAPVEMLPQDLHWKEEDSLEQEVLRVLTRQIFMNGISSLIPGLQRQISLRLAEHSEQGFQF